MTITFDKNLVDLPKGLCPKFRKERENFLIILQTSEVKELRKRNKNHRLVKTCGHKYYMCNDDWDALYIVARMRGHDANTFYHKCVEGLNYA